MLKYKNFTILLISFLFLYSQLKRRSLLTRRMQWHSTWYTEVRKILYKLVMRPHRESSSLLNKR